MIFLGEAFDVYQPDDSDILLCRFYSTGYIIVKWFACEWTRAHGASNSETI